MISTGVQKNENLNKNYFAWDVKTKNSIITSIQHSIKTELFSTFRAYCHRHPDNDL